MKSKKKLWKILKKKPRRLTNTPTEDTSCTGDSPATAANDSAPSTSRVNRFEASLNTQRSSLSGRPWFGLKVGKKHRDINHHLQNETFLSVGSEKSNDRDLPKTPSATMFPDLQKVASIDLAHEDVQSKSDCSRFAPEEPEGWQTYVSADANLESTGVEACVVPLKSMDAREKVLLQSSSFESFGQAIKPSPDWQTAYHQDLTNQASNDADERELRQSLSLISFDHLAARQRADARSVELNPAFDDEKTIQGFLSEEQEKTLGTASEAAKEKEPENAWYHHDPVVNAGERSFVADFSSCSSSASSATRSSGMYGRSEKDGLSEKSENDEDVFHDPEELSLDDLDSCTGPSIEAQICLASSEDGCDSQNSKPTETPPVGNKDVNMTPNQLSQADDTNNTRDLQPTTSKSLPIDPPGWPADTTAPKSTAKQAQVDRQTDSPSQAPPSLVSMIRMPSEMKSEMQIYGLYSCDSFEVSLTGTDSLLSVGNERLQQELIAQRMIPPPPPPPPPPQLVPPKRDNATEKHSFINLKSYLQGHQGDDDLRFTVSEDDYYFYSAENGDEPSVDTHRLPGKRNKPEEKTGSVSSNNQTPLSGGTESMSKTQTENFTSSQVNTPVRQNYKKENEIEGVSLPAQHHKNRMPLMNRPFPGTKEPVSGPPTVAAASSEDAGEVKVSDAAIVQLRVSSDYYNEKGALQAEGRYKEKKVQIVIDSNERDDESLASRNSHESQETLPDDSGARDYPKPWKRNRATTIIRSDSSVFTEDTLRSVKNLPFIHQLGIAALDRFANNLDCFMPGEKGRIGEADDDSEFDFTGRQVDVRAGNDDDATYESLESRSFHRFLLEDEVEGALEWADQKLLCGSEDK